MHTADIHIPNVQSGVSHACKPSFDDCCTYSTTHKPNSELSAVRNALVLCGRVSQVSKSSPEGYSVCSATVEVFTSLQLSQYQVSVFRGEDQLTFWVLALKMAMHARHVLWVMVWLSSPCRHAPLSRGMAMAGRIWNPHAHQSTNRLHPVSRNDGLNQCGQTSPGTLYPSPASTCLPTHLWLL